MIIYDIISHGLLKYIVISSGELIDFQWTMPNYTMYKTLQN